MKTYISSQTNRTHFFGACFERTTFFDILNRKKVLQKMVVIYLWLLFIEFCFFPPFPSIFGMIKCLLQIHYLDWDKFDFEIFCCCCCIWSYLSAWLLEKKKLFHSIRVTFIGQLGLCFFGGGFGRIRSRIVVSQVS